MARRIIHSQGMVIAHADREVLRQAIGQVDVVHFVMPFYLSAAGLEIARELNVPCTAAFHVQPENITYTLHMGRSRWINKGIYYFFRESFITISAISTVPASLLPVSFGKTAIRPGSM